MGAIGVFGFRALDKFKSHFLTIILFTLVVGSGLATQAAPWYILELSWLAPYDKLVQKHTPWLDKSLTVKSAHGNLLDPATEEFRQDTIKHIFRVVALSVRLAETISDDPLLKTVVFTKALQHDREKIDSSPEYLRRHSYNLSETVLERLARFNGIAYKDLPTGTASTELHKQNFDILKSTFNQMADQDHNLLNKMLREELGASYTQEIEILSSEIVNVADKVDTHLARNEEFNKTMVPASIYLKDEALAKLAAFLEDQGQHLWILSEGIRLERHLRKVRPTKNGFHLPIKPKAQNYCQVLLTETDS